MPSAESLLRRVPSHCCAKCRVIAVPSAESLLCRVRVECELLKCSTQVGTRVVDELTALPADLVMSYRSAMAGGFCDVCMQCLHWATTDRTWH